MSQTLLAGYGAPVDPGEQGVSVALLEDDLDCCEVCALPAHSH